MKQVIFEDNISQSSKHSNDDIDLFNDNYNEPENNNDNSLVDISNSNSISNSTTPIAFKQKKVVSSNDLSQLFNDSTATPSPSTTRKRKLDSSVDCFANLRDIPPIIESESQLSQSLVIDFKQTQFEPTQVININDHSDLNDSMAFNSAHQTDSLPIFPTTNSFDKQSLLDHIAPASTAPDATVSSDDSNTRKSALQVIPSSDPGEGNVKGLSQSDSSKAIQVGETPMSKSNPIIVPDTSSPFLRRKTEKVEAAENRFSISPILNKTSKASTLTASQSDEESIASSLDEDSESSSTANEASDVKRFRVFAFWPNEGCFTATIISKNEDDFEVKFDDGSLFTLPLSHIMKLEIRQGDEVKMLDDNYKPKGRYQVVRSYFTESGSKGHIAVDGSNMVELAPMRKRGEAEFQKTIECPVSSIFITRKVFSKLHESRPVEFVLADGSTFHEMKSLRHARPARGDLVESPSQKSTDEEDAEDVKTEPALEIAAASEGNMEIESRLLEGILFSVSGTEQNSKYEKMIRSFGGTILADGFANVISEDACFRKDSTINKTVFGCVISTSHSRRWKYLEALALGFPCLSVRFIEDAILNNTLPPWERYLLAAGSSLKCEGAIVSIHSGQFSLGMKLGWNMRLQYLNRKRLMESKRVLIVFKGEKSNVDGIDLGYLLGHIWDATSIEEIIDTSTHGWGVSLLNGSKPKAMKLDAAKYDFVYITGVKTSKELNVRHEDATIVCKEWVIQSIISGYLI
ncbi:hypothetical protein CANCADRAFT_1123 [Tortispora caseinolytica NRRL Y-17796]|uniref:BRCT domain-containing protein n=1 Tax=Tortispora caseinolytica NRRL Y-17796 TaxID=767744 RepID=A0A1E4TLA9_9ASCO|nr:hypothetical protein CANCADRAFT_1123 [Tortispora caseinolytica NRRL Y-17796]